MRMIRIFVLDFFGSLQRDIQDILDYKEWTRFSQLYHFDLKAEREVQGRQQQQYFRPNTGRYFSQCSDINKPKAPIAKPLATLLAAASTTPTSEVSNVSSVQPNHRRRFLLTVLKC